MKVSKASPEGGCERLKNGSMVGCAIVSGRRLGQPLGNPKVTMGSAYFFQYAVKMTDDVL